MKPIFTVAVIAAAASLQACSILPREDEDPTAGIDYRPAWPAVGGGAETGAQPSGAVFTPAGSFDLFMDLRARAVGDILTIELVERTNASKESKSSAAKDSSVDTGFPIFAGKQPTANGVPFLNNEIEGSRSFDGSADASQSNRLDGNITVTVAERLPNGNLLVRGEKLININQGEEYIRLQGIVRPVDIGPANSVASTKVADAKISYSGKGHLADSSRPGWITRFFNSPWFPF
jgi:flagellar L-ring protein precursor FlgH